MEQKEEYVKNLEKELRKQEMIAKVYKAKSDELVDYVGAIKYDYYELINKQQLLEKEMAGCRRIRNSLFYKTYDKARRVKRKLFNEKV